MVDPTTLNQSTESWSQLGANLGDWAVRPVRAGCYSWAALSLIDSKTQYTYYFV